MENLELFPRNLCEDFFLKISVNSAKVYTEKVPSIEECNFIPAPLRSLDSGYQASYCSTRVVRLLFASVCLLFLPKAARHISNSRKSTHSLLVSLVPNMRFGTYIHVINDINSTTML